MTVLLVAFILATSVWVGGLATIVVVALSSRVLEPAQRVAFFRTFGRAYLPVGLGALVVALGTGAGLLADRERDASVVAALVLAVLLVVALGVGVIQARRMTRLRALALAAPEDSRLRRQVHTGGSLAALLRAGIGLITLALVVLGSTMAV